MHNKHVRYDLINQISCVMHFDYQISDCLHESLNSLVVYALAL